MPLCAWGGGEGWTEEAGSYVNLLVELYYYLVSNFISSI